MGKIFKGIVATHNQEELAKLLEKLISTDKIEILAFFGNGCMVIQAAQKYKPDFLLLDASLKDHSAIEILKISREKLEKDIKVIIFCDKEQDIGYQLAKKYKADLILERAVFDKDIVCQIKKVCQCSKAFEEEGVDEAEIIKTLEDFALEPSSKGFTYIKESLIYAIEHKNTSLMLKTIFSKLCEDHDISFGSIYYQIRKTISASWDNGLKDRLDVLLGYNRLQPTSFEILHLIYNFIS